MSNNDATRVLNRMGARELTLKELEVIAAARGPNHTEACTSVPSLRGNTIITNCDPES